LDGGLVQHADGWDFSLETQLFLNQPFGKNNSFVNTPERQSFTANFDIDPLQSRSFMWALATAISSRLWAASSPPFGRFYFSELSQQLRRLAIHSLRSHSVSRNRAAAAMGPGHLGLHAALTNGSFQQDTNSSKAIVLAWASISRGMRSGRA